jgi:pyruvate-ferredoxin/flavodoxin oxidoreductase
VKNAFYHHDDAPLIVGGRYALGGKDVLPNDIAAVFDNLNKPLPMDGFTLGLSMMSPLPRCPAPADAGGLACRHHRL